MIHGGKFQKRPQLMPQKSPTKRTKFVIVEFAKKNKQKKRIAGVPMLENFFENFVCGLKVQKKTKKRIAGVPQKRASPCNLLQGVALAGSSVPP